MDKQEIPEAVRPILEGVFDPEIPVLNVVDMGVVRKAEEKDDQWLITITPTYSGCPAMKVINDDIVTAMQEAGYKNVEVKEVLQPAWTTDWLTEDAKRKLKAYGIAPPQGSVDKNTLLEGQKQIQCPQCGSYNTKMVSQFGSTACKSLYQCNDCKEPFDYFKCL